MRSAWVLVFTLSLPSCRREQAVIYADLPDATGVREGAVVRYRGVPIGQVQRVTFADSVVHITIGLTRSDAPLRTRDGVRLAAEGMFGDRALDVVPGPALAPASRHARTLRAAPPDSVADLRRELLEAAAAAALREVGAAWRRDTSRRDSAGRAPTPGRP